MAYAITALLETPLANLGEGHATDAENMNPNAMGD
jgi:hypothetical protein